MSETIPLIALAGNPNSGKTALFNALTGSRQKVANYPGVTVERKEGQTVSDAGQTFRILDLPGAYSLNPRSPDEEVMKKVISGQDRPDLLVAVLDANQIQRSLSMVLELQALKLPLVVVLNMMDLAKARGLDIDLKKLSTLLGAPVIPTVATQNQGIQELLESATQALKKSFSINPSTQFANNLTVQDRYRLVDQILSQVVVRPGSPSLWTRRIDSVLLHPIAGLFILAAILLILFQAIFTWASAPADLIEAGLASFGTWVGSLLPDGNLKSLIVDGMISGVGAVLVFLPQILLLFLGILLLEDSGYMSRAAFLMDRIMGKVGLHGRALIPLLSSYACAIPGIMATRTIENPRDRITTILVAPLTTCSARLPVYTLLISAFIPDQQIAGLFNLQGLVMFGLYAFGIVFTLLMAFVFKRLLSKDQTPPLLLELPTYKVPNLRNIALGLWERAQLFIKRAGTVILSLSIVLWFLVSFPKPPEGSTEPAIHSSYAGRLGHFIEPAVRPIGFDWRASIALIPGFAAREVMVGALATVYAVEGETDEAKEAGLATNLAASWSLATALSLLMWYVFAPQCISTIAVIRRETNSWKWPLVMFSYMIVLAYGMSWITYQIAISFGA